MKNIPHFYLSRFFSIFPSAMSILPITALIKHKIAAENHELAIQV